MTEAVTRYLGIAFVLILVFLIVRNADQFKKLMNSLGSANAGAIVAFQGGNPGQFVSS